jgi:hypothetical protein
MDSWAGQADWEQALRFRGLGNPAWSSAETLQYELSGGRIKPSWDKGVIGLLPSLPQKRVKDYSRGCLAAALSCWGWVCTEEDREGFHQHLLQQWVWRLSAGEPQGAILHLPEIWWSRSGVDLRFCIPNKFSCDADATNPRRKHCTFV